MLSRNIMVAIDGSTPSRNAFELAADLLKPQDKIEVIHIFTSEKKYLPHMLQQQSLKIEFQAMLSASLHPNYDLIWEELDPKKSLKVQILEQCSHRHASLLAFGYYGRKGEKKDISSALSIFSLSCSFPLLIAKKQTTRKAKKGEFHWLVCMDGSESSHEALEECTKFAQLEDTIDCICVETEKVKPQQYETAVKMLCGKLKHNYIMIENKAKENACSLILKYASSKDYDIMVFGTKGSDVMTHSTSKYIGSVVKNVILNSATNIMLIS